MAAVMIVGWLYDRVGYTGGAELTTGELAAAAPAGIDLVECLPGHVARNCDVYCIHNCIHYSLQDLKVIPPDRPVIKYWNDVGSWYSADVRAWLDKRATPICCSGLQAREMGLPDAKLIPPPVNLDRFAEAKASVNGNRRGTVSVAQWRSLNKGPEAVLKWAEQHGEHIDFYGGGPFAPPNSHEIDYQLMPQLLARYQRFVFLPYAIEPFGRLVAEAHAAGCELVTNRNVGALEWLEKPDAIRSATSDYWDLVLNG